MSAEKSIFDLFSTNVQFETDGIWIDYGSYGRVKIARAGGKNRAFRSLMERRLRPYRSAMNMGTMDEQVLERITRECFAETVVLDWEFLGPDGEPLPFSKEKCVELFEALPDFFTEVVNESQRVVNFVEQSREHDAKG